MKKIEYKERNPHFNLGKSLYLLGKSSIIILFTDKTVIRSQLDRYILHMILILKFGCCKINQKG